MRVKEIRIICDGETCADPDNLAISSLVVNDADDKKRVNIELLGFRISTMFELQGWRQKDSRHYCPHCWDEKLREKRNQSYGGTE